MLAATNNAIIKVGLHNLTETKEDIQLSFYEDKIDTQHFTEAVKYLLLFFTIHVYLLYVII